MSQLPRILSLKGEQALSILRELQKFMEVIAGDAPGAEVPQPCEWFDVIGGTGSGHLVAIMLTQLRMSVDQCIEFFLFERNTGTGSVTPVNDQVRRDHENLKCSIKEAVRRVLFGKTVSRLDRETLRDVDLEIWFAFMEAEADAAQYCMENKEQIKRWAEALIRK